jgi:hypothetical protein
VSFINFAATFIYWPQLTLGSDPFLLVTNVTNESQISIIAEDVTQRQIIHISGAPPLPPSPSPVGQPPPQKLPTLGTGGVVHVPQPSGLQIGPIIGPALIPWQIETRAQSGTVSYQFVDSRPTAILNQDGTISIFVIGTTDLNNLSAQHLLEMTWNSSMPLNELSVFDLTTITNGNAVWQSTSCVMDSAGNNHVFAVTIAGKLEEYILTPGHPPKVSVNNRTGTYSITQEWGTIGGGGTPSIIGTPAVSYQSRITIQNQAFNELYEVAVNQYVPPVPTLLVASVGTNDVSFAFGSNGCLSNYFVGFSLWRSQLNSAQGQFVLQGSADTTYQDNGLSPGTGYSYKLFNITASPGGSLLSPATISLTTTPGGGG